MDTEEIDFSWEGEGAPAPRRRGPREAMPTLHDPDPLRHDLGYRRERDPTRESFPTLHEIDPLQYDVEDDKR